MRATFATISMLALLVAGTAAGQSIPQLEQQLKDSPSLANREALAEAYLRECRLEDSLRQWRIILNQAPDHARAKAVVERLTAQALDLDSQLDLIDRLMLKGITGGLAPQFQAAAHRAATDEQKARILYLTGRVAELTGRQSDARAAYESAMHLHPNTTGAARAAVGLGWMEATAGRVDLARKLIVPVINNERLIEKTVRQEAALQMVRIESRDLPAADRVDAVAALLKSSTEPNAKRLVLLELLNGRLEAAGQWTPEAVATAGDLLATDPPFEQVADAIEQLLGAARGSEDPATLDEIIALTGKVKFVDVILARRWTHVAIEAALSRAVVADNAAAVGRLVNQAVADLGGLQADSGFADARELARMRGRALLVQGQKLVTLSGPTAALPALTRGRDHFLATLTDDPDHSIARLFAIGDLLEQVNEVEMAAWLYSEVATRRPHTGEGQGSLLRVAVLQEKKLDAPMQALETFAEYSARYPADLPYRQLAIGERLERLGYANVLDFQKRNGLKPDGIFGNASADVLTAVESRLDLVRLRPRAGAELRRGDFVHPAMYRIATGLEKAGRHHDAIVAYRLFVNLFPTKREADDCVIRVARLFRDNLLFEEALGAYRELMDDYPNGDKTSEAYIEAAACLENLGRWREARELYQLYAKKFPRYKHVELAKARVDLLEQIQQYEDFLAANPDNPKRAEAMYQIASILYKEFGNNTKAAVEFEKVARAYPKHFRAPDALFTAGVAYLRAENFQAARERFAELVKGYAENRLADDGQYWIGHTWEYRARALGRLDDNRIMLRKRSIDSRAELLADLELRRRYFADAAAGAEMDDAVWGDDLSRLGVLAAGSIRDRVNADLKRAVAAYRLVPDNFKIGDMADDALLRIGTIYTKYLNDPEKGIAAYRELLAHYPGSKDAVDALYEVGAYHLEKKQYDDAIKAYQQFIYSYQSHPKAEDALMAIARCHTEQKSWDKALDAYQSYLNQHPQGSHAEEAARQVQWIRTYIN